MLVFSRLTDGCKEKDRKKIRVTERDDRDAEMQAKSVTVPSLAF